MVMSGALVQGEKAVDIQKKLIENRIKYIITAAVLIVILVTIASISVCMGVMEINVSDILSVVGNKLFGFENSAAENVIAIIWSIRLPRILCAVFVGMGLAVSGVIFQGILQNPLADPYTLGVSTGASFGASVSIIINLYWGIYFPVSMAALIGAAITLAVVILIARKGSSFESSNLIIAGIILSSILSSGVSFIKMLAGENVGAIVFWIMGSLSAKGWKDVYLAAPVTVICTVLCFFMSDRLDIMALGDESAKSLGINADRVRLMFMIIGSVMTAVCVAVCGVIGFVGLIVPHLLRFLLTSRNTVLVPLSALFGAVLLLSADSITRIFAKGEIPVGVLTTLIGGPFFIFVFTHRRDRKNG